MFNISLNRIHDTVRITEGSDSLILKVNGDPRRMVAGLNTIQKALQAIGDDTPEDDIKKTATDFAAVIFGTEQAEKLLEFYHQDAGCVINVCGQYFANRLKLLIVKAQKKAK
jgi:hypothetical protein